jgi:cell division protein FtsL
MTNWGRARIALLALAVVAVLFVFVFPTRSYLAQRRQVGAAAHDVSVLQKQNAELEQEAARLRSPDEIERVARQQYNYVFPGERVYKVMPANAASEATTTTTIP